MRPVFVRALRFSMTCSLMAGLCAVGCASAVDDGGDSPAPAPEAEARPTAVPELPDGAALLAKAELSKSHSVSFYRLGKDESLILEDLDTEAEDVSALHGRTLVGKPLGEVYRAISGSTLDASAVALLDEFDASRPKMALERAESLNVAQPGEIAPRAFDGLELTDKKTEAEKQAERDQQARRFARQYGCLGSDGDAWDWLDHLSQHPGCEEDGCVRICGRGEWGIAGAATPAHVSRYSYGIEVIGYNQFRDAGDAALSLTYDDPCENDFWSWIRPVCRKGSKIFRYVVPGAHMVWAYSDKTSDKWHRTAKIEGPNRLGLGAWWYDAKTHDYDDVSPPGTESE